MYVKAVFEIFKILGRLGIKNKDVIGMGGNIVKMGKSLFNTRVNPKLLTFIEKNQKIPTKILENIKLHARTLKNASENQKNLFLENIKSIQNAKFPKPPVTGVRQPGSSNLSIGERMSKIRGLNKQLDKARTEYKNIYKPRVREEAAEAFKGWKPTVIKGGKDKLATGGRAGFDNGGDTTEKSWFNIVPQYDEEGNLIPIFSKTGDQQIHGAPEGVTSDKEFINFVMSLDIPIDEKISLLGDLAYGKGREKIEYKGDEIALGEGGGKSRKIGIGYNEEGEGFGGHVKYDVDSEEPEAYFKWSKTFAKGGIANHFRAR